MRRQVNLVMKGGVSSGLVYARLIACLESEFAFSRLAGASAGAIAASLTAAAEFARRNGDPKGFQRVETQSEELALNLKSLLQPSAPFRPCSKPWSAGARSCNFGICDGRAVMTCCAETGAA